MANLQELSVYKNRIIDTMYQDTTLLALLFDASEDPVTKEQFLQRVFPHDYLKGFSLTPGAYIFLEIDGEKVHSQATLSHVIRFHLLIHKDHLSMESGTRADFLMSELCKLFNGNRNFGIGPFHMRPYRTDTTLDDYYGRILEFTVHTFNLKVVDRT